MEREGERERRFVEKALAALEERSTGDVYGEKRTKANQSRLTKTAGLGLFINLYLSRPRIIWFSAQHKTISPANSRARADRGGAVIRSWTPRNGSHRGHGQRPAISIL